MSAPWIFADQLVDKSKLYRFEKTFTAPAGSSFTASLCADSRYKFYFNGVYITDGPCHGTEYHRHYDTVDLTPYLKEGENTVRVDVLHVMAGEYISVYRGPKAALWFDGLLTCGGEETPVVSDLSWTLTGTDNHCFAEPEGYIRSVPPMEHFHGDEVFTPVALIADKAVAVPEKQCYNIWGVRETYPLTPRPIPRLKLEKPRPMKPVAEGEHYREYDSSRYETAFVRLRLAATPGTHITVTYAECRAFYDEDGGIGNAGKSTKGLRDDPAGEIRGLCDTFEIGESGEVFFESFNFRSFRFVRIEADGDFAVPSFEYVGVYYPIGSEGHFTCSDPNFNRMWEISRHTMLCCTHENFVDCPYYEQQQYCMDSGLEMMFMLRMTADTAMARKSISDLAASQIHDGMLQANYPSTVVQVLTSFSLYWIMMLKDYLDVTGDTEFVRTMAATMTKIIAGFECYTDGHGMVGVTPYWQFVDWVPGWYEGIPDGADSEPLTVYSMMYSHALRCAAEICTALGMQGHASDYLSRSEELARTVYDVCFDAERGMFRNTPTRREYCQHTALWAVLCGAVKGAAAARLMSLAMETDDIPHCSFSMRYYLFRALERTGLYDKYAPDVFAGWQTMIDQHCTTWCENPDAPRSECHAWSSGPIFELSSMVLGVRSLTPGFETVEITPHTFDLDYAEGAVPTPHGIIEVSWKRTDDGHLRLYVTNPAPETMKIIVPFNGGKLTQTTRHMAYYI